MLIRAPISRRHRNHSRRICKIPSGSGLIPPPKCKTEKACRGAFELLKLLSDGDDSVLNKQLILINNNHLDKDECKYLDWNYSPVAEQRSKVGYVGIKNLGCICYKIGR